MNGPAPDDLTALRDRLAAQEATVITLHAKVDRLQRRRRLPRRSLPVILAALLVALVPLATLAANPFNDLNHGSVHNPNIDAIFNAGITTGCDPGVAYCPSGNVTREEMASFLARTAGLGSNPPVVNAKTAQTAQSAMNATNAAHANAADTATTATNATNATNAQNAVTAQTATNAINAQTAASATNATTATNATNATSADTASRVGGYLPSELVRVATAHQSGAVINPSAVNSLVQFVTVQIAVPGPGYVLVNGAASFRYNSGAYYIGNLDVRHVNTGTTSSGQFVMVGNGTNPPAYDSASTTSFFTVTGAPATHTFILEVQWYTGPGDAIIGSGELNAIFIPFGSTGVTP